VIRIPANGSYTAASAGEIAAPSYKNALGTFIVKLTVAWK